MSNPKITRNGGRAPDGGAPPCCSRRRGVDDSDFLQDGRGVQRGRGPGRGPFFVALDPGHAISLGSVLRVGRRDLRPQPLARRVDPGGELVGGLALRSSARPASGAVAARVRRSRVRPLSLRAPALLGARPPHRTPAATEPPARAAPTLRGARPTTEPTTDVVQSITDVGLTTCRASPSSFGDNPSASPTSWAGAAPASPGRGPTTFSAKGPCRSRFR